MFAFGCLYACSSVKTVGLFICLILIILRAWQTLVFVTTGYDLPTLKTVKPEDKCQEVWVVSCKAFSNSCPLSEVNFYLGKKKKVPCDSGVQNILSDTGFLVFCIWKSNSVEKMLMLFSSKVMLVIIMVIPFLYASQR